MEVIEEMERPRPAVVPWHRSLQKVPWWMLILLLLGVWMLYFIFNSEPYRDAFLFLVEGVYYTILVTLISFSFSLILGLVTGFGRVSKNPIFYTIATLYVEVVRGIPLIVQLIYVAFVATPLFVSLMNSLGNSLLQLGILTQLATPLTQLDIKGVDMIYRAIAGLAIGYGAYEAEVFRAGIESIEKGQMEAARSLGMSYFQAMRYVILPQAIRRVLPPLGNDFIAMLKDSSLVSVLAVRDLTQLGKLNRARTFRTFETWNTVTFLYLTMTILLSLGVKWLEKRMTVEE